MAAHDALVAVWTTGRPAGATGTNFAAGDPIATKIGAINTWRVAAGGPVAAQIEPSRILNAILAADLNALTQLQTLQLTLALSGNLVDVSQGTTIRLAIQTLFAGKTQTLSNLAALVAPYDNPTTEWWRSVGFESPVCVGDAVAAGLR